MLFEVKAKMVASSLIDGDAVRDAEWEEVWYVSAGYRFETVRIILSDEIRQKEDTNPLKPQAVLFDIGPHKLTGYQVLQVLWLIGEGGPGMSSIGDETVLDESWINHAKSSGVL